MWIEAFGFACILTTNVGDILDRFLQDLNFCNEQKLS